MNVSEFVLGVFASPLVLLLVALLEMALLYLIFRLLMKPA